MDTQDASMSRTISVLQDEVRRLKEQLLICKTLAKVCEDLTVVSSNLRKITSVCANCQGELGGESPEHDKFDAQIAAACQSARSPFPATFEASGSLPCVVTLEESKFPIGFEDSSVIQMEDSLDIQDDLPLLKEENDPVVKVESEPVVKEEHEPHVKEEDADFSIDDFMNREDMVTELIMFGSVPIPADQLLKLRDSKITFLAAELCMLVFSAKELALCSLKGKQNNKYKHSIKKRPIDEERVEAIINYVCKAKDVPPSKMVEQKIRKAIAYKLNNFSKTPLGKSIIAQEKARLLTYMQSID